MSIRTTKLIVFALVIVLTASLMMGINAQAEQVVRAQNMTANMTDSAGDSTGTNDTGSISGLADL